MLVIIECSRAEEKQRNGEVVMTVHAISIPTRLYAMCCGQVGVIRANRGTRAKTANPALRE